jgi:RimJ/RimL family protein N-acetyltransferase
VTIADVTWPQRTERLVLRPVRPEDVDRLLEFRNQPEVYRWLLKSEVDPSEFRAAWLRTLTDERDLSSVAELDGTVIGTASLSIHDGLGQDQHEAMVAAEADIGYLLDPAYAGRGFGTEIARALLHIAFDIVGVHRATAGCFADNLASVRILEKVGMRREQYGVQDSWHSELGWVDGATYGMLAEEWQRATASGTAPGR